ncbi:hypothetical protein FPQ18DRAFT_307775 [Pyronema domesticum]|nr:hypothetical protein FPQ18DRAFT_307775 [Pyronema domesticum]
MGGDMKRCGDPSRMVSQDSAICPLSEDYNQIAIQDHLKMVKFRSRTDPQYQRMYSKIQEIIEHYEEKLSKTSFTPMETTTRKAHFMMPFPKNDDYIGKSQIRELIDGKRKPFNNHQQIREHIRVGLCGLGGAGSTKTAINWQIYLAFQRSKKKNSSQDFKGIVKSWLESEASGNWVLVLDNADNKDDFFSDSAGNSSPGLAKYIPSCAKGIIVITTRDHTVAVQLAGPRNVLAKKEAMDPIDTDALFKYHYPSGAPYQDTGYIQLLEELKRLPLAVTQVASYLETNHGIITPSQYLQSFRNTKDDQRRLLSTTAFNTWRSNKDVSATVLTTFSNTFRQIQEQSSLAGSILRTIACIDPQAIPHRLLSTLSDNEIQLGEAISKLRNLSLLEAASASNVETVKSYTVHSLVHIAARWFLSQINEEIEALKITAQKLLQVLPDNGEYESWPAWRVYLPHTTAFFENTSEDLQTIEVAHVCFSMAKYLHNYRDRDELAPAQRSFMIRVKLLSKEHLVTLDSMEIFANLLSIHGKLKEAETLQVRMLEILTRRHGEDHPRTPTAMYNIAGTLGDQGRLKEAEDMYTKVVEARIRLLGEEHPHTLISMGDLALMFCKQARFEEAMEMKISILDTSRRVLGTEHQDTLMCMHNLAHTYHNLNRINEAIAMVEEAATLWSRILGSEHQHTKDSMEV